MDYNHGALSAKLTSSQIANQNRQPLFNHSVLAAALEKGTAHSTNRRVRRDGVSAYQCSRLANISRYCCVTSGLFRIILGDVSVPMMTFVYCACVDQKEANLRIFNLNIA